MPENNYEDKYWEAQTLINELHQDIDDLKKRVLRMARNLDERLEKVIESELRVVLDA